MTDEPSRQSLPHNVKVLGIASLLNDIASEMVFPLLPGFLLTFTAGNKFALGLIEGLADSVGTVERLEGKLRDATHQILGKGKSGDTSKRPYALRFSSTVTIGPEKR